MENSQRENPLLIKSFNFSLSIVSICFKLQSEKSEFVLSKQLLRSGTAIGALAEEVQQAESKADFIHKLAIANKEAQVLIDCEELKRLLVSIIKSSKSKK